jgi:hypothetical protein
MENEITQMESAGLTARAWKQPLWRGQPAAYPAYRLSISPHERGADYQATTHAGAASAKFIVIRVKLAIHRSHLNFPHRWHVSKSFAERRFDAEPYSYDETSYDDGDDSLEYIALCLLDSSAPAPQVLKIRAKVPAIIFVHSEGSQRRRDGFENHCIDIV